MPLGLLWAYVAMLPRLQARESLRRIHEQALSQSNSQEAKSAMRRLERAAAIPREEMSGDQLDQMSAAWGFRRG